MNPGSALSEPTRPTKLLSLTLLLWSLALVFSAIALLAEYASASTGDGSDLLGSQSASPGNRYVTVELISDVESFQAPIVDNIPAPRIGVLFQIEPGWHIYWKNSGDLAIPTRLDWHLPSGWRAGDLQWPVPTKFYERSNLRTFGYRDEVLLFSDLFPPDIVPPTDQPVHLSADISWLVCKDICVPGRATVGLDRTFGTERALTPSRQLSLFDRYKSQVPSTPQIKESAEQSPQAWQKLRSGIELSAPRIIETKIDNGNAESAVSMYLASDSKAVPLSPDLIQLFPFRAGKIAFGEPRLYGPIKIPGRTDNVFEIRLPFSQPAELAQTAPLTLSGILVLSPELDSSGSKSNPDGTNAVQSANWKVEWDSNKSVDSPIAGSAPDLGELTYRTERRAKHPAAIATDAAPAEPNSASASTSAADLNLLQAIGLAFVGGLILNLMPCVLPIVSIKVLGFVEKCSGSRRNAAISAGYFSFGIIVTMCALATVVVISRSAGAQIGWGFQFQYPGFVAGLTLIIFWLALGFFEVYNFSLPCQFANRFAQYIHHPAAKHSFDGVLTVLLSTPCTAPFLGSALAFAFSQPAPSIFAIFIAIGVGLSLPYVIFSVSPPLLRLLPKPGNWMHGFRQLMGFLMLLTVIWLLTVLDQLTESGVNVILLLMLLIYFLFWLRKQAIACGLHQRRGTAVNCGLTAIFACALIYSHSSLSQVRITALPTRSELINWEPFSTSLITSSAAEDLPVFIDFTAAWCITCKANERLVIETDQIAQAISGLGIKAVKADWTAGDPAITEALGKFGATGVPLYVVIPKGGAAPIVLPPLLTTELLLNAFKTAVSS